MKLKTLQQKKKMRRIINPFYFIIKEIMKPFGLLLILVFILSNMMFFMICEDDLQASCPSHAYPQSPLHEKNDFKELKKNHDSLDLETNRKYCGSPHGTCKFLFIYSPPSAHIDLESISLVHTFSHIATLLNRTMVLPNVGYSHLSSNHYYNTEALKRIFPTVNFISHPEFERWTKERSRKPIAQHLHITNGTNTSFMISRIDALQDFSHPHRASCFDKFDMQLNRESTYHCLQVERDALSDPEKRNYVTELLEKSFFYSGAEVLLIRNDVSQDVSSQEYPIIPYSTRVLWEARRIKMALEPYVAIHWKMEGMRAENTHACVERLKSTLMNIKNKYGIRNVYLSTDYPISSEFAHPNSNRRFKKHHHRAMVMLSSTVNISSWISLNAFGKMRQELMNKDPGSRDSGGHDDLDEFRGEGGIQRMLDQMVCVNADYFLSGPSGCCKQWNVFTRTVGNSRREISEAEDKKLLNIMTMW